MLVSWKTASILLIITLLTSVFATANSQVVSGAQEEWTGRIDGQGVINEREYNLTIVFSVSGDFSFRVLSDNTITGNGVVHVTVDWKGDIGIAVCYAKDSVTITSSVGRIYYPSTNEVSLTFDNSPKSFTLKLVCSSKSSGNLTYYVKIPTYIDAPVFMKLRVGAEYLATQYYPAEDVKIPLKFSIIGGGGGGGGGGGIYEKFDFSISVMDTTLTVSPGNSVVTTVTVYLEKGTAQPVTLKVSTAHTELLKTVKVSLSKITGNPNFSSDLTIITSPDTPQGTFTIAVVGEGDGITRNKQLTLVIGEGKPSPYPKPSPTPSEKPDFTLSVLPKTLVEVTAGKSASWEIKVNWLKGNPERVKLNVESNPHLIRHKISLSPVETQALMQSTAGLTIQTKPNPTKGFIQEVEKYEISITAKSVYSGITKSEMVTLVVKQKECKVKYNEPQFKDPDAAAFEKGEQVREDKLKPQLRIAVDAFKKAIEDAGGEVTITSAWRPAEYQDHLYEVWSKYQEAKKYPECADITNLLKKEMDKHGLHKVVAKRSKHSRGLAVDMVVTLPPNSPKSIDDWAKEFGLYRPLPDSDGIHFELIFEKAKDLAAGMKDKKISVVPFMNDAKTPIYKIKFELDKGTIGYIKMGEWKKHRGNLSTVILKSNRPIEPRGTRELVLVVDKETLSFKWTTYNKDGKEITSGYVTLKP